MKCAMAKRSFWSQCRSWIEKFSPGFRELRVGRVNVYLLDTDIPENSAEDRLITAELYGGDLEMRMRQEIMLGFGGVKALTALGIQPDVFHMNEGHSAFLALERIRVNVAERKLDFYSALQVVAGRECFYHAHSCPCWQRLFCVR